MIDPALAGLITAAGAITIAYLAHRSGNKKDRVIEQSGVVTENRAGTAQVIEGLNAVNADLHKIIDSIQEDRDADRAEFREDKRLLREDLLRCAESVGGLAKQLADRDKELARMYRKHGENGGTP